MMWWVDEAQRQAVLDACMDAAHPQESAGVVAMALHGMGRAALEQLAASPVPQTDDILPAMANVDVSVAVTSFAKAVGPTTAHDVLTWHYDAACGARAVANALVARKVPVQQAIAKAAAAYGIGERDAAQYAATVAAALPPPTVVDLGLRGVQRWAQQCCAQASPPEELVSKEIFIRRGYQVDQPRDDEGQFAAVDDDHDDGDFVVINGERVRLAPRRHDPQADEDNDRQSDEDKAAQMKDIDEIRRIRRLRKQRRARKERRVEADRARLVAQFDQQIADIHDARAAAKTSQAGAALDRARARVVDEQRQATKTKREKRLKRVARVQRVKRVKELTARQEEIRERMHRERQERERDEPLISDPIGVDWDPPAARPAVVRQLLQQYGGVATPDDSGLYVMVPLDVIAHAKQHTSNTQSRFGPRISIQAANEYLTAQRRNPLTIQTGNALYGNTIVEEIDGEWYLPVAVSWAITDDSDFVAPFQSVDAAAAFRAFDELTEYARGHTHGSFEIDNQSHWAAALGADGAEFSDMLDEYDTEVRDELFRNVLTSRAQEEGIDLLELSESNPEEYEDFTELVQEEIDNGDLGDITANDSVAGVIYTLLEAQTLIASLYDRPRARYLGMPLQSVLAIAPDLDAKVPYSQQVGEHVFDEDSAKPTEDDIYPGGPPF